MNKWFNKDKTQMVDLDSVIAYNYISKEKSQEKYNYFSTISTYSQDKKLEAFSSIVLTLSKDKIVFYKKDADELFSILSK